MILLWSVRIQNVYLWFLDIYAVARLRLFCFVDTTCRGVVFGFDLVGGWQLKCVIADGINAESTEFDTYHDQILRVELHLEFADRFVC